MTLHLLLPLVLLPATLSGEVTRRIGITALVGEIGVGILLGPAVADLLPQRGSSAAFYDLAHIGLCALLFRLGVHSRPNAAASAWRSGLLVGLVGMALSFLLGYGLTLAFGWSPLSAAFVGAALTASSISVPVTVLRETRREHSPEGATILAAAFITDVLGLVGLSFLTAFVSQESAGYSQALRAVGQSVAFIGVGFFVGPFLVRKVLGTTKWLRGPTVLPIIGFSYLLVVAYAAKFAGLAMVIGAYAAGLAFARLRERGQLEQEIDPLILILRPLFFVLVGASISVSAIDPTLGTGRALIVFSLGLVSMGLLGKFAGALPLRIGSPEKRVVGFGMVARGGMGFVFAEAGHASGMLPAQLFSAVALALTANTVIGAVGLRFFVSRADENASCPPNTTSESEIRPTARIK